MKRLEDRIYEHLKREATPMAALELAREFLGCGPLGAAAAGRIVDAALGRDPRFYREADGWAAAQLAPAVAPLAESRWLLLAGETRPSAAGAVQVVAVMEYDPGHSEPLEGHGFILGPTREVQAAELELAGSKTPVFRAATQFQLLRYLDELFQRDGIFVSGLQAGPVGEFLLLAEATGSALPDQLVPMADLLRLVLPAGSPATAEALFRCFPVETTHDRPFLTELAAFPGVMPRLIEQLALRDTQRRDELWLALEELHRPLDFSRYEFTRRDLEEIPEAPGVYRFYDASGRLIYVGKSVRLRRRVRSYFRWAEAGDPKLAQIQSQTVRFGFTQLGSDLEALLEEAELIMIHHPPVNTQLEIHEQPREKPAKDPLVILMPHADEARVQIFLFHPSGTVSRLTCSSGQPDPALLEQFLETAAERNRPCPAATVYHGEVYPLALRWLRKNSHQLTYFRYHDFPGRPAVVESVLRAIREGAFRSKVIYR